ncbi:LysR family transcriptional regulator [Pseudogracilibacillus auburnensis]|uniref:LysR family transcriptional regulator n=1 Tax=Pseudogracilibacillus auburnensis TaxID=1494959 RepID=A0A2V3WAA3_9BACI|nr:LysR family transcriptional regulator [Pseudogracilibacillus auburnensis]MBO1001933.1 LysR family transcriptional regulator [Pseudogracilibacillus auburnensis]PXW90148.1 LysR family transcriptional regulator [Pseudogracilibacillus auburnensis]
MRLRQLEYVHSIVEHKTMREAARNLYVTEPTISQQIRTLEKQLETTIFERDGRGIRLTEQGEQLYPFILDVLNSVDKLKQQVELMNNPDSGEIMLGLGPILTDIKLQRLLEAFKEGFPKMKISIYESGSMDLLHLLEKGELDIAIINSSIETRVYMEKNNIACKPLYESNFILMTSTQHPLAKQEKVSYKDLYNEPLMLYRNGLIQKSINELLGAEKNIVYSFVDYISIIHLVRDGLGVSILPKSYVDGLSSEQKQGVTFLEFSDFGTQMKVSCIYKQDAIYPSYIKKFIDLLLYKFKISTKLA